MDAARYSEDEYPTKSAALYRMVMPSNVCPFGLKSTALLERDGYACCRRSRSENTRRDRRLHTRTRRDTTPQIWIGDERLGDYDGLRAHFGKPVKRKNEASYQPVIAIFSVAFLIGLAISWAAFGTIFTVRAIERFVAVSMTLQGVRKLRVIKRSSTMFLNCNQLARP